MAKSAFTFGHRQYALKSLRKLEVDALARGVDSVEAVEEVFHRAINFMDSVFPDDPFRAEIVSARERRLKEVLS